MSWRLRVEHTTRVTYAGPVLASLNEARMTPPTLPTQVVHQSRVDVGPGFVPVWSYDDYWGTRVSVFDLPEEHDCLQVRAVSTVETSAAAAPDPAKTPDWEAVRRAGADSSLLQFCLPTGRTTLAAEVAGAVNAGAREMAPATAAETISDRVRERVAYVPGATEVRTGAQEAWDKGQGVCQDMAHVTVALLRAAGLPARYVSGYLHPDADAAPGSTATGQSHAWVEYWAGDWFPLDPTSGAPVAERHVVVARGRDYGDVPPLKGIYRGPGESSMNVTVQVTRLA